MRILHLISSSGLFGAERVVLELSKGLKRNYNCQPVVGVIRNSQSPHIEIAEEAAACCLDSVIFPCRGRFDPKLSSLIGNFVEQNKIDIVHCHGYKSNIYGLLASRNRVPSVTTNHNWLTSGLSLKLYCFLDSCWIRYFNRIVAVSEKIKKEMLKFGLPEKKIRVIDNGIDLERFAREIPTGRIKEEFGLSGNLKIVGTVGSLTTEKGYIHLLKAAKSVLDVGIGVSFLIVGEGPLRNRLEEEAGKLGIRSNIVFAGYRSDIPEMLSTMDIFILSSIKEGLPMVLLEAMAAKKPVIATAVGAVPEVIRDHRDGLLVQPGDIEGLKRAIMELARDPEKADRLAANGYERVKNFSSGNMAGKYFAIYKELQ